MRFHFGISFRLRNLKKFLFPFILGLLSYFGFSYFNLFSVYAYSNLDTSYNVEYLEFNEDDIFFDNYTYKDILNHGLVNSPYYNVNIYIINQYARSLGGYYSRIIFVLVPNTESLAIDIVSDSNRFYYENRASDYYYTYEVSNNSTWSLTELETTLTYLDNALLNNEVIGNQSGINLFISSYGGYSFNNNNSYNIIVNDNDITSTNNYERFLPYYNGSGSYLTRQRSSSRTYYEKSVYINHSFIDVDNYVPFYCDIYDCGSNSDESFDLFLDKLPFIYSNTNDLSTYNSTISFSPTINVEDYVNNLYTYKFYYGRVNHGTYYTYEQLNCTSSSISTTDELTVSINTTNVNCNNDLTKYDKYFITYNFKYENDSISKSIYGFLTTITNGFIEHNTLINYYLLDDFNNLPRGFSLMLSNNDTLNNLDSYFYSSNPYIAFDDIPKNISNITKTTNGIFYKDLPIPKKRSYGFTTNTNLLVYDDLSYSTDESTTLFIYLNPQTLLSFVDTSNNQNNYTYYDSNNNITTSSINLIYDNLDNNQYDLSYYFNIVNDTLNGFNNKLIDFHNFNDELFNQIPVEFQSLIILLVILCLSYALFKVVRS